MISPARARALCLVPLLIMVIPVQAASAASTSPAATHESGRPAAISTPSPTPTPGAPDQTQPQAGQQTPPTSQPGSTGRGAPATAQPSLASPSGNGGLTHEVFGFATSGTLGDPNFGYPSWNFNLLSTVAFFAIHVNYQGVLVADSNWNVWSSSTLTGLVSTAHAHGTKVVVTLRNPSDMCGALYGSDTTTLQIVNQVVAKGIDGVNIDYEGQLATCPQTNQTDQVMLTNFAHKLRVALDNARPGYYLSIDTYSGSALGTGGFFDIASLNQYVDSFFVMTYDMDYANQGSAPLTCSGFCMAPVSPLANYYWNDSASMSQYIGVVGAGKTILGQPYYGRVACVGGAVTGPPPPPHAVATRNLTPATYLDSISVPSSPDVAPGTFQVHRDGDDPNGQDRWDSWWDTSLGCWREMYWSDTTTLGVRYDLVNQDNLRGVGFWTLNYGGGSPELWDTLWTHFVLCTSGSLSSAPASPAPAGSTIAFTAASTGCLNPQYEYWIQYPNGTWNLMRGWGGPTFNWNTTGLVPGTYTVHAWVNRSGSSYETIGSETMTLTGCTSASVSPPSPTAPAGTTVSLTAASAGGCPNPVYQFFVQYPNGSWNLKQGWGTSAVFNWDTTGLAPGTYTVHAWANQQGASPALETFGSSTVTLTGCTSATLAPSSGTQPGGTVVSFTAGSSGGCPNPVYEFWVLYPNGTWNLKQGWGTSAAFNWDTTALPAGTYTIHAWANQQGAAPTLETYGSATLMVTGCSAATVSPANPSAPAGSTVALTAGVSGCVNAQFEFFVQYPGGAWHLKQGWGGSTFNWDTSGLAPGTYTVHAWANRTGTTWEAIGTATVTLTGCSSSSISPPTGTTAVGGMVTFTASSAGCPNPVYEFFLRDPAGTWHLEQGFSTAAGWTWNTAGWAKGTYTIHVWANNQGADTTTYETIGSATYTLT